MKRILIVLAMVLAFSTTAYSAQRIMLFNNSTRVKAASRFEDELYKALSRAGYQITSDSPDLIVVIQALESYPHIAYSLVVVEAGSQRYLNSNFGCFDNSYNIPKVAKNFADNMLPEILRRDSMR